MSTLLIVRANRNGRRTVHRPLGRPRYQNRPARRETACGWYGDPVYSSLGDTDLADAVRCLKCWPDDGGDS